MKEKLALLLIKVGLFFANCDGDYDPRERDFIKNFLRSLELNNILDTGSFTPEKIETIEYKDIHSVIKEMNEFIGLLQEEERHPFISMIDNYIQGIIKADNVIDPNETLYYNMWKEKVKP